jgi:hypothetical protein
MKNKVIKIAENVTGRNVLFKDVSTGHKMTRREFVSKIENNVYDNYHVRTINNIKTPCGNPDKSKKNNLG